MNNSVHNREQAEGLVLVTFGAGNGPSRQADILDAIGAACSRGVLVLNVSQCKMGRVDAIYQSGSALAEAGVISGGDITIEAALAKLSFVCGMEKTPLNEKRKILARNICGEITPSSDQD